MARFRAIHVLTDPGIVLRIRRQSNADVAQRPQRDRAQCVDQQLVTAKIEDVQVQQEAGDRIGIDGVVSSVLELGDVVLEYGVEFFGTLVHQLLHQDRIEGLRTT